MLRNLKHLLNDYWILVGLTLTFAGVAMLTCALLVEVA